MTEQREGMTELGEGKTELDKLIKAAQAVVDICDRKVIIGVLEPVASNCIETLRQAVGQAKVVEPDKRIAELEQLVKAQQKAFDIESNRIIFAQHKSLHKMLISDAIKKMKECQGRPYSAWDMWLIDAKCMLERVLREWPAPQEVTLTTPPSIDALIAQAIEKHDEKMTVIKTVNTRKIAQPYIDALIAEIEAIPREGEVDYDGIFMMERDDGEYLSFDAVMSAIEKYRGVK